jgi:hypothetical protein
MNVIVAKSYYIERIKSSAAVIKKNNLTNAT